MTQCTSSGYGTTLLTDPSTIDTNSERWDVNRFAVRKLERLIVGDGITGNRSPQISRTRRGPYTAGVAFEIDPTWAFWNLWLPRILGADESSDTFAVAEELPTWNARADLLGNIVQVDGCKVDKLRLKFAPDKLVATLECPGLASTETGLSLPAVSFPTGIANTPQGFMDCTINIASGNRNITEGELLIDNQITPHMFAGLAYTGCLREGPRIVTFTESGTSAAADWSALYGIAATTITITIAYLNMSTVFTLSQCIAPIETPEVAGKGEIPLDFTWTAHASGTTPEIVVTNDPVNT